MMVMVVVVMMMCRPGAAVFSAPGAQNIDLAQETRPPCFGCVSTLNRDLEPFPDLRRRAGDPERQVGIKRAEHRESLPPLMSVPWRGRRYIFCAASRRPCLCLCPPPPRQAPRGGGHCCLLAHRHRRHPQRAQVRDPGTGARFAGKRLAVRGIGVSRGRGGEGAVQGCEAGWGPAAPEGLAFDREEQGQANSERSGSAMVKGCRGEGCDRSARPEQMTRIRRKRQRASCGRASFLLKVKPTQIPAPLSPSVSAGAGEQQGLKGHSDR